MSTHAIVLGGAKPNASETESRYEAVSGYPSSRLANGLKLL